jgi:hypothetical protein
MKKLAMGAEGRNIVFLTNLKKGGPTDKQLEVGFRQHPDDPPKKIHYSDAIIGGAASNWNIPETARGLQSGICDEAYREKEVERRFDGPILRTRRWMWNSFGSMED